jgi:hypothetical protein
LAAGNSIDLPPPSCERTDNKFEVGRKMQRNRLAAGSSFRLFAIGSGPAKQTADLVLHNGAIYTDERRGRREGASDGG